MEESKPGERSKTAQMPPAAGTSAHLCGVRAKLDSSSALQPGIQNDL